MSGVLRWEEPPPSRIHDRKPRRPSDEPWRPVAEELRRRPGDWGVVYEGSNGTASGLANTIKMARVASWEPIGAFDATYRKDGDVTRVWARYIGEES